MKNKKLSKKFERGEFRMNKLILTMLVFFLSATIAHAGWVQSYYRKDGIYVQGHYRSDRNDTVRDNYSYEDNYNPYTGKTGSNHYRSNRSSEYYDPYYDYGW